MDQRYNMSTFIRTLEPVVTRNLEVIVTPKPETQNKDELFRNPKGHSLYRGICGSTQWAVTQGSPDHAGNAADLQSGLAKPTVGDLKVQGSGVEPTSTPE